MNSQQFNTELLHNLQYDVNINDIWGYASQMGDEYAIVGLQNGTSVVYVSRNEIYEVAFIPGETSTWRDIKVWDDHIYIGTENGSGGIQIVSMENPENPELVNVWDGISSSHNIMIDSGYLFIIGSENEDLFILDLENPANPELVSTWSGDYLHDICIKDDLLFGCAISSNMMHILDISDKLNPISIGFWDDVPAAHACWADSENDVLITASETTGGHIMNWDISDLNDIQLLTEWAPDSSENKSAHNVFIRDNFAYISYYVFGLQILDITNPELPELAGYYDTYPGMDGLFNGAWGTYPFQNSCNIYISDRQTGLYVIEFEGCLGADPEDPVPPQNLQIYSDYLSPNSVSINWTNPELLYNGDELENYEINIFRDNEFISALQALINNFEDYNLIDGIEYNYELVIIDLITDSTSIGVIKSVYAGGHPIPQSPIILNTASNNNSATFEIQIPSMQLDNTPLDDIEFLIVLRNGSVIDSIQVEANELLNYNDNPIPGYFYNYEFYVIDNEFHVNESDITNPIELFVGEFPQNLILSLCNSVDNDALIFLQDLNLLGFDSFIIEQNQLINFVVLNSIENLFVFSGIFPNDCDLNENSQNILIEFLDSGGNVYLEGGDIWNNLSQSNLIDYVNIKLHGDGINDLNEINGLDGTLMETLNFYYIGANNWIDRIHGISPAYPVLQNFEENYELTVFNPQENYNTISSSFELSGIDNLDIRLEVIQNYINFFNSGLSPSWLKGDVNFDNLVNILDIISVVEFIIELSNPGIIEFWVSDLNHDDFINIQDITLIINNILAY